MAQIVIGKAGSDHEEHILGKESQGSGSPLLVADSTAGLLQVLDLAAREVVAAADGVGLPNILAGCQ